MPPFTTPTVVVSTRPTATYPLATPHKELRLKDRTAPSSAARIRNRWVAEFTEGTFAGECGECGVCPDEAIGSLVRAVARRFKSPHQVLDFLASLFGDLRVRPANEQLTRALWFAAPVAIRGQRRGIRSGWQLRKAVGAMHRADQVLDFVAGVFGDRNHHAADVILGRVLRRANQHPRRTAPGCRFEIQDTADAATAAIAVGAHHAARGGNGGVA